MEDRPAVESESVALGILELNEAKRLKTCLKDQGIELTLVRNPTTCSTGGCKPTVELHVAQSDLEAAIQGIQQEQLQLLDQESGDYDLSLLNEAIDPEKASARCPACSTDFSPQENKACPDCGLNFFG